MFHRFHIQPEIDKTYQLLPVMTTEQRVIAWANAYNAALTGFLACNTLEKELTRFTLKLEQGKTPIQRIADDCKEFADQALQDLQQFDAKVHPKRLRQEA
jgi:hypothetical protein